MFIVDFIDTVRMLIISRVLLCRPLSRYEMLVYTSCEDKITCQTIEIYSRVVNDDCGASIRVGRGYAVQRGWRRARSGHTFRTLVLVSGAVFNGESNPDRARVYELREVPQTVVEWLFENLAGRCVDYDRGLLRHLHVWTSWCVKAEIPSHESDRPVLVVL